MPKVSVITPTYNRDKFVKKCIDSVLSQTLVDIEFIIIDDGSIDDTENIIKSYNDDRLIYMKQTNHGIGYSRNQGIEKAKGDFLTFLDIDDYLEESCLEKMYQKATSEQLDIVISDYYNFYEDGRIEQEKLKNFSNTNLENKKELLLEMNLGPSNKLFSRTLFNSARFPEHIKYEDIALMCELFKSAKKIGKLNESLYYFLVDNKSETTTVDERSFDIFVSLDKILDLFKEKEYESIIQELIISKLATYTIWQRKQKDKNLRNQFIEEAFAYMQKVDKNYKRNIYFRKKNKIKSMIEKNKFLTKVYCNLYQLFH